MISEVSSSRRKSEVRGDGDLREYAELRGQSEPITQFEVAESCVVLICEVGGCRVQRCTKLEPISQESLPNSYFRI
jgi:hypothetical protein